MLSEETLAVLTAPVGAKLGFYGYDFVAAPEVEMDVLGDGLGPGARDAGHYGFCFFVAVDGACGLEVFVARGEGGEGHFWRLVLEFGGFFDTRGRSVG